MAKKKPTTLNEFVEYQENLIEKIREKIKNEFDTLAYSEIQKFSAQILRRKNLIGLAKCGKIKDYFIYS